jgi:hypothetical protein
VSPPRSLDEIARLIERYPPSFRRYCSAPKGVECACTGCVGVPAYYDRNCTPLTKEEVEIYQASKEQPK